MKLSKYKKLIIAALSAVFLLTIIYTQVMSPVIFKVEKATYCITNEDTFEVVKENWKPDELGEGEQYFKNSLPSNNYKDYISLGYEINVQNISVFDIENIDSMIEDIRNDKGNFLSASSSSSVMLESVNRLGKSTIGLGCFVYIGGLNEEQIKELVQSISIKLVYQTEFFGTRTKTFNMSGLKNITNTHDDGL